MAPNPKQITNKQINSKVDDSLGENTCNLIHKKQGSKNKGYGENNHKQIEKLNYRYKCLIEKKYKYFKSMIRCSILPCVEEMQMNRKITSYLQIGKDSGV